MVIALSILAVGLLGAMRAFPLGLRASQRTALSSRATIVAQRTIEALKLISPDELPAGETVQQEDGFEVATRVATPDVEGLVDASQLKEITVTVQWEQGNRTRDLSFVTYGWLDTS